MEDSKVFEKKVCLGATLLTSNHTSQMNKKTRLKWCVDMIEQGLLGDPRFKDFF